MLLGIITSHRDSPIDFERIPDNSTHFSGVIKEIHDGESAIRMIVDVDSSFSDGIAVDLKNFKAELYIPTHIDVPCRGDIIYFSGVYSSPLYPVDLPGDDNRADYCYVNSISLRCYSPPDSVIVSGKSMALTDRLSRMQSHVADMIVSSGVSSPTAAFLCAVIAGDDSLIDRHTRDNFAAAGTAHVIALSGLHIGIITAIIAILLFPVAMSGHNKLRWGLVCIVLWFFAVFTGMSPSVVRSVLMATAVIMSIILDRPRSSLNALCFAAIVILAVDPHSLYSIGFQLSFAATAAIVLFVATYDPDSALKGWRRWLCNTVGVTIAATIATLPLSAFYFERIPLFFLPANILMTVMMPIVICGGLVLIIMEAFGGPTEWITSMLDWSYAFMETICEWIGSLPAAVIDRVRLSGWMLITIYFVIVSAGGLLIAKRKRLYAIMFLSGIALSVVIAVSETSHHPVSGVFVTRDTRSTDIVVAADDRINVYSTAQRTLTSADSAMFVEHHAGFIRHMRAKSIGFHHLDGGANMIFSNGKHSMKIAFSDSNISPIRTDYCLVIRQFNGSIVDLWHNAAADTIVLANDIPKMRHQRYCRELEAAGTPFISMRDSPFSLSR